MGSVLLILGGTGEARALAAGLRDLEVISSLAGRVSDPALPIGQVRIGGFGGADGLAGYLRCEQITAVVDATHPFAATISAHAATACAATGIPLLGLRRPAWVQRENDTWHLAPDTHAAAALVTELAPAQSRVLLTTGRRDLAPFCVDSLHHYVIRSVDEPTLPLPYRHELLLDRGPYTVEGELELLRSRRIALLVSKNSGGPMTYPKIEAARALDLPVVMINRPPTPPGVRSVGTVAEALIWCRATLGGTVPAVLPGVEEGR